MSRAKNAPSDINVNHKISLISETGKFLSAHPFLSIGVVFVCLLSYGFFATRYTYHTDSLVSQYYDGDKLITAGRFVAPLLSFVTNWMAFSPFWQTALLCVFLILAGLLYAMVIKREAERRIPDGILFLFIMAFVSEPVITGQLTYPNLNIGLSFALVPLALWAVDPFRKNISAGRFFAGTLLMAPAIDMYESFAPVFLVCVFFLLLVRLFLGIDRKKSGREYVLFVIKKLLYLIGVLGAAIVLEYAVSKIVCKICSGSFDFWYSGNTTTHWMDTTSSFLTSMKKLLCCFAVDMVLVPTEYFWAFLYTASVLFLGGVTLIFSFRNAKKNGFRKTVMGLLLFFAMFAASKALDVLLCRPAYLTQMQPVQLFTAFSFLTFVFCVSQMKKRAIKTAGLIAAVLVILLQTQTINNYAVKNQERFDYENHILDAVCDDLAARDLAHKSVCFYAPENYSLPNAFQHRSSANPVAAVFRKCVFALWEKTVPSGFMDYLNRYFSWVGIFNTAEDCLQLAARRTQENTPYFPNLTGWYGEQSLTENTFQRKGLTIKTVPGDNKKMETYYNNTSFHKGETYRVIEDNDLITVFFITPDD